MRPYVQRWKIKRNKFRFRFHSAAFFFVQNKIIFSLDMPVTHTLKKRNKTRCNIFFVILNEIHDSIRLIFV